MSDRILRGALGAALFLTLGACSEQVTSSLACPELCTDQSATLRDTVLTGVVVLDTTFTGFPLLGETRDLALVARGDTADVRIIARFDTLTPTTFLPPAPQPDSLIAFVDSAAFLFQVDTTFQKPTVPITIDAFDVDTTAADTVPSTLLPLFRDDRLIGSSTYPVADVKDTLRLPLTNAVVLDKLRNGKHLRIGLRMRAPQSTTVLVVGRTFAPRIRFRVSADTTVRPDTVFLHSKTPTTDLSIATSLAFYPLHAAGALPPPPPDRTAIGGIGGARTYMQFEIPAIVLDSVQIVRASLLLTQVPSRFAGGNQDTLTVITHPVVAGPAVTDIFTASQFLGSPALTVFHVDTLRLIPRDAGQRSLEIVRIVRSWRSVGTARTVRALVLRAPEEGLRAGELNFYSIDAPDPAVRPRLRLTYVPRRGFGLP